MVFGNLLEILEEDNNKNTVKESKSNYQKKGKFASILSSLSSYGMNYDDDIYKNMKAIPADKLLQPKDDPLLQQSLYGQMNNWRTKSEEDKPFKEKSLQQKREILRKLATQPEIEDILDIMANECIVYNDEESYICTPFLDNAVIQDLNEEALSEIRKAVNSIFYKIYLLLGWKHDAWNQFRRYLVDGVLSFEIIYDNIDKPHSIIGIVPIDPGTLTRTIKDGITYWVQFKGELGRERELLDAQVIYIKYEDSGVIERQSYLERLIRPFNIYRIIEQAQIVWTVTQASFKTMFTIPVAGMSKKNGLQTLNAAMNRYREEISFNQDSGELRINGKTNMPFNKEFWMPENENGKPEIETLVDSGPTISDSEQLKYFENKLYKMSKIPSSRFDTENQPTWFGTDASQQLRDEINFSRFVTRIRSVFSNILIKPLKIQLALQIPDIKNDKRILDSISLRFNSYNQFTELMEAELNQKRMEHIQTLKDTFTTQDKDGNEQPFFCDKFLIIRYLKMSDSDLELNEKYKIEQTLELQRSEEEIEDNEEDSDSEDFGDEKEDMFGGDDESDESDEPDESNEPDEPDDASDIDQDMLGDVQPEEPEPA